ncbi:MAG: 3-deoxy-D-manno-octulosonic acid transferase [Brevundimonas sp.]|jgi:3-deoxy-D-manno-octulosonic-acid transferase|uniref:3-deoxy-D-manno-octulosonic acid transferase n=1 Tax=Brevundimonas sp. TaxID=1871086 RepID=UPI00391CF9B4
MTLMLGLWRLATQAMEPVAPHILRARAQRGKEDPARLAERLGQASAPRASGPLVWVHGVSVGESVSALPLVRRIAASGARVLMTSGTPASAEVLATRLGHADFGGRVVHQYAPLDAPGVVGRFLDHWQPDLALFVESELWPNTLMTLRVRNIPSALISARITEHTEAGWRRFPRSARALLSCFDLILAQDETSAARLESLGARTSGLLNLKLAGEALSHDAAVFSRLSEAIGDRPVVLLLSTHEGEDLPLLRACRAIRPRPLMIVMPRHPARADHLCDALRAEGFTLSQRSQQEAIAPDIDVYVADTLGEAGLFIRLADMVVVAGSFLSGIGGHNPLEPARLSRGVITGPDIANWAGVYEELIGAGGALKVETAADITAVLSQLLADNDASRRMGQAAQRHTLSLDAGLDQLWPRLERLMQGPGA